MATITLARVEKTSYSPSVGTEIAEPSRDVDLYSKNPSDLRVADLRVLHEKTSKVKMRATWCSPATPTAVRLPWDIP
jgi:hypothetical protein